MDLDLLLLKIGRLIDQIEDLFHGRVETPIWENNIAFRWITTCGSKKLLQPIARVDDITTEDLYGLEEQLKIVEDNTRVFASGHVGNNILLTGARGTGKSSLIKSVFKKYSDQGLKLIDVGREEMKDLGEIISLIEKSKCRFIIFCDDLSFEAEDSGYKSLKAVLDGSMVTLPTNALIYATSNRRHLMPEYFSDNQSSTKNQKGEIHPNEAIEESISLSDRFGIWVPFYPFDQKSYLEIVKRWTSKLGGVWENEEDFKRKALQWATSKGSRSGRAAKQFAIHWIGEHVNNKI